MTDKLTDRDAVIERARMFGRMDSRLPCSGWLAICEAMADFALAEKKLEMVAVHCHECGAILYELPRAEFDPNRKVRCYGTHPVGFESLAALDGE